MAKQRIQVAGLDAPTIASPVASPVNIYTTPAAPVVNNQLSQFIAALAPAVEAKQDEVLQYRQELERSVKLGFAEQEAYQAELALTELNKVTNEAYVNNKQYYLDSGRDQLAADRTKFFTDFMTTLEDQGINSSVIQSVREDLELSNLEFFSKVYNPDKTEYDKTLALNTLTEQLTNVVNTVGQTTEIRQTNVNDAISKFKKAYPNVSWDEINGVVENHELALSSMKDSNGVPRGSTELSDWLVANKRDTTTTGARTFAVINNNQAAREVAQANAVKTSIDSIVKAISVPTINSIESMYAGAPDMYNANPEKLAEDADNFINKTVEDVRSKHGDAVADALKLELMSEWNKAYTKPSILGEIQKAQRDAALGSNMDAVLQVGIYDTTSTPEQADANLKELLTNIVENSGLTELEVKQRLVDIVVQNAAEKGGDNAVNRRLIQDGVWQENEFQDERQAFVKALKTYDTKTSAKLTLEEKQIIASDAVDNFVANGSADASELNNLTHTDAVTGDETKIPDRFIQAEYVKKSRQRLASRLADIDKQYDATIVGTPDERVQLEEEREQAKFQAQMDEQTKAMTEFYLPAGLVPEGMAKQINNSAVMSVLTGTAGQPVSEAQLTAVATALQSYATLNNFQDRFGNKAFKDPDDGKRLQFLHQLTTDGGMELSEAIEAVQGPLMDVDSIPKVTIKALNDFEVDGEGFFSYFYDPNPFAGVANKSGLQDYMNANIAARVKTLGEPVEKAFDIVAKEALEDFHIQEYANGVSTAVFKRNTDLQTLNDDVGGKLVAATDAALQLGGMPELIQQQVPDGTGGLVMMTNPTNANMVTMYITDDTGRIAYPVTSFSFDELNTLPLEMLKDRIVKKTNLTLSLASEVTEEEQAQIREVLAMGGVAFELDAETLATQALAKQQLEEKRRKKELAAAARKEAEEKYNQSISIPTASQSKFSVGQVLQQILPPEVSDNLSNAIADSADAIDAKIVEQRRSMSDRVAIKQAKIMLKNLDPALVEALELDVWGIESGYLSDRGITVKEQASRSHAVMAILDTLQNQTDTDFLLKSKGITMKTITQDEAVKFLDETLSQASAKKNVTPEDVLNKVLLPIAWHESAGTMDPTIAQRGGGPARGIMQFEPASFQTAVTRAEQWLANNNEPQPQWLTDVSSALDDAGGDKGKIQELITTLPAQTQLSLATYDLLQHPNANISKVISGEQTITEFWAEYWWAGDKSKKASHMKSFNRSLRSFDPTKIKL